MVATGWQVPLPLKKLPLQQPREVESLRRWQLEFLAHAWAVGDLRPVSHCELAGQPTPKACLEFIVFRVDMGFLQAGVELHPQS